VPENQSAGRGNGDKVANVLVRGAFSFFQNCCTEMKAGEDGVGGKIENIAGRGPHPHSTVEIMKNMLILVRIHLVRWCCGRKVGTAHRMVLVSITKEKVDFRQVM
jgi:hypothetical protein